MINSQMRNYNYFVYGAADEYGQVRITDEAQGTIKMAINIASQSVHDSVLFNNAQYVGLTLDDISDKYVIDYEGCKLKVSYVNPKGRFKQAFLVRM